MVHNLGTCGTYNLYNYIVWLPPHGGSRDHAHCPRLQKHSLFQHPHSLQLIYSNAAWLSSRSKALNADGNKLGIMKKNHIIIWFYKTDKKKFGFGKKRKNRHSKIGYSFGTKESRREERKKVRAENHRLLKLGLLIK